jgi:hypothetical protein
LGATDAPWRENPGVRYIMYIICLGGETHDCVHWCFSVCVCGVWCVVCGVWCVVCGVCNIRMGARQRFQSLRRVCTTLLCALMLQARATFSKKKVGSTVTLYLPCDYMYIIL